MSKRALWWFSLVSLGIVIYLMVYGIFLPEDAKRHYLPWLGPEPIGFKNCGTLMEHSDLKCLWDDFKDSWYQNAGRW